MWHIFWSYIFSFCSTKNLAVRKSFFQTQQNKRSLFAPLETRTAEKQLLVRNREQIPNSYAMLFPASPLNSLPSSHKLSLLHFLRENLVTFQWQKIWLGEK